MEAVPHSSKLPDDERIELVQQILEDQDGCNSSDWQNVLLQVILGSESAPTFKLRMTFALMSDGCVLWKDVVCRILLHRLNTTASEIFPALGMFDKLQDCTDDTDCSAQAVAALLERNILKIKKKNEGNVRDVLKGFDIDFSKMMLWW